MRMDRDEIMGRVADADPLDASVIEAWERSGGPDAVLARVLASPRVPVPARTRPWVRRRWAWAAMAAVLVTATGLGLTAWLAGPSGRADSGGVLMGRRQALTTLVAAGEPSSPPGRGNPAQRLEERGRFCVAAGYEVMRDTGAAGAVTANAATWGDAVTWMWAIYSGYEVPVLSGAPLAGSWRGAQAGMIAALMRAGIVPADTARLHPPVEPITASEWNLLLSRLSGVEMKYDSQP
jgi:hypothetical protein